MHPVFEEILRARADSVQPHALRRWQQIIREELAPLVDRCEQLERENVELKTARPGKKKTEAQS